MKFFFDDFRDKNHVREIQIMDGCVTWAKIQLDYNENEIGQDISPPPPKKEILEWIEIEDF